MFVIRIYCVKMMFLFFFPFVSTARAWKLLYVASHPVSVCLCVFVCIYAYMRVWLRVNVFESNSGCVSRHGLRKMKHDLIKISNETRLHALFFH